MRRAAMLAVLLAGCASPAPEGDYDAVRQMVPRGAVADGLRARFRVELFGSWEDGELAVVAGALEMFPNKDMSALEFYRMPRGSERGGRYELGRVTVREPTLDVLLHELGHAVHSRCPARAKLDRELDAVLAFESYSSASEWADGTRTPRGGFVTPYSALNVEECVADWVAAVKLWSRRARGPLERVDWQDDRFGRVFDILDRYGLTDDEDRLAVRRVAGRPKR